MKPTVETALALWGLPDTDWALAADRENKVFKVVSREATYALRLHRKGLRSEAELRSEVDWMAALEASGINVPRPVPARDGSLLKSVDGLFIDVLVWLPGEPFGDVLERAEPQAREAAFRRLGAEIARLHAASDDWRPPQGFTRWSWNREGLLGEAPLWGRFWDNPDLSAAERRFFEEIRSRADVDLAMIEHDLDFGLIHADAVRENVLVDGTYMRLIDFDDGGHGFRLFDLATALGKFEDAPDFATLKAALFCGYREVRPIDEDAFALIFMLRALTYVGWGIRRRGTPEMARRDRLNIDRAMRAAEDYFHERT